MGNTCVMATVQATCEQCGEVNQANLLEDRAITRHRDRYYATLVCSACYAAIHVSLAPQEDPREIAAHEVQSSCSMPASVDCMHKGAVVDYATACLRCGDVERLQEVIHVLQNMPPTTSGLLEALWPKEATVCE